MRFRSPPGLVYPPADVLEVRQHGDAPPDVTVGMMGLTGPSGVLPRYYTEIAHPGAARALAATARLHRPAGPPLRRVLRARRREIPAGAHRRDRARCAGADRPIRSPRLLLALTGYGTPHLTDRLAAGRRAAAALRRPVRHAAALGGSAGRDDVRLARHAGGGGGVRRRLAVAAARPAHPAVRRTAPGAGSASMPRPACAPGTRRRASSCASARWTCRASSGCCRIGSRCTGWSRWCAPMSVSSSASPSIRCSPRGRCRRCG